MRTAKERILKTIKEHDMFQNGDHVVLGLSGGPDSLCLFDVLFSLKEDLGLIISTVHVNHEFRGKDSEEDQKFVEDLCLKKGISCKSVRVDCNKIAEEKGISGEEAGRLVRYENFRKTAEELEKTGIPKERIKIVVAQNRNDQAETILFRIIRGTGIDGLSAMKHVSKDVSGFYVLRPLLDTKRSEVEDYILDKDLTPRIDKTNYRPIYTRNKIRLNLIPRIDEEFGRDVSEALLRLGNLARIDGAYMNRVAMDALEEAKSVSIDEVSCEISLDRKFLVKLDEAILSRVLKLVLAEQGLYDDLSFAHIDGVMKLIKGDNSAGHLDLPKGYGINVAYDTVEIGTFAEKTTECPKLKIKVMSIEEYSPKENLAAFDKDVLDVSPEAIVLRSRRPGDYINLKIGRKSVQDLFVDMKVPKHRRDEIKMACAGNRVLWILEGYSKARYCEVAGVSDSTKNVITLEIARGI